MPLRYPHPLRFILNFSKPTFLDHLSLVSVSSCPFGFDVTTLLAVQKSKNTSLINIQGIVITESENTFVIITKENKTKGRIFFVTWYVSLTSFQSFQSKTRFSYCSYLHILSQIPYLPHPRFLTSLTWFSRYMATNSDFVLRNVLEGSLSTKRV